MFYLEADSQAFFFQRTITHLSKKKGATKSSTAAAFLPISSLFHTSLCLSYFCMKVADGSLKLNDRSLYCKRY